MKVKNLSFKSALFASIAVLCVMSSCDSGEAVWSKTYAGSAGYIDEALATTVDSENNVYVTGYESLEKNNKYDDNSKHVVTIKYNASGEQQWIAKFARKFTSGTKAADKGTAITIGPDRDVYVLGTSLGETSPIFGNRDNDYLVIKYNSRGTMLWYRTYNGTGNNQDSPAGFVVDSNGSIYITGQSIGENFNTRVLTIAYDKDGNQLWSDEDDLGGNSACAYKIALDSSENIIIAATEFEFMPDNFTNTYVSIIKFTSNGNKTRLTRLVNDNISSKNIHNIAGMALDSSDNIYITGHTYIFHGGNKFEDIDVVTIKFSSKGSFAWGTVYNSSNNENDEGVDITVGSDGHVYVAANTFLGINEVALTIKYDQKGKEVWSKTVGSGKLSYNKAVSIHVDGQNRVFTTINIGKYIIIPVPPTGLREFTSKKCQTVVYNPNGSTAFSAEENLVEAYATVLDEENGFFYLVGDKLSSANTSNGIDMIALKKSL